MTIRLMEKLKTRPQNAARLCRGSVRTKKETVCTAKERSGAEED